MTSTTHERERARDAQASLRSTSVFLPELRRPDPSSLNPPVAMRAVCLVAAALRNDARTARRAKTNALSRHAQYPTFDLRHSLLRRAQGWPKEGCQRAVMVRLRQPSSDAAGVRLIGGAPLAGEAAVPHLWIDFGNDRTTQGNIPPVERPEADARAEPLTDESQPRNSGVRGLRH
jgi:hypothetical protein